ncbi:MAG: dethiobiotin synthase [Chitinophagaceae bacterium]
MSKPIFITGIGTEIGKTVVSSLVTTALKANYWKPIQAGFEEGADADKVAFLAKQRTPDTQIFPEAYRLSIPASPHIAARKDGITIDIDKIIDAYQLIQLQSANHLIIEGAGGLMVPINQHQFVADIIKQLNASVILVSRNYLGSINHSLLTAAVCKQMNVDVLGWIFNDQYLDYEEEIVEWSGYPKIASIPKLNTNDCQAMLHQALLLEPQLRKFI